jgi:hypothetical protein
VKCVLGTAKSRWYRGGTFVIEGRSGADPPDGDCSLVGGYCDNTRGPALLANLQKGGRELCACQNKGTVPHGSYT